MNVDKIKWLNNDFFFSGECKWISDKYQNRDHRSQVTQAKSKSWFFFFTKGNDI